MTAFSNCKLKREHKAGISFSKESLSETTVKTSSCFKVLSLWTTAHTGGPQQSPLISSTTPP
ncbi:MAG: hypothetical protein M0Z86_02515 [Deltaproteobacteria bacterium]|nr:hypothetical protein [Deltaproteobacteria bacterium]